MGGDTVLIKTDCKKSVCDSEFLFSLRHPVLHLPLRPRRHGCNGNSLPEGHLPVHPAGLPPSAGQGAVHSHQGPGEAATQTGLQCIPLLLRGEYRPKNL